MEKIFEVFNTTINQTISIQTQVEFKRSKELPIDKIELKGDLAGFINLDCSKASLFIGIAFPMSTYLGLMSSMLGEEYTTLEEGLDETIKEFLNITFGTATPQLKQMGYEFEKKNVDIAKKVNISKPAPAGMSVSVGEYTSDKGNFTFGVFLKEK
jgi:CheY-specific phosphatase CheX